ncbi:MAG: M23 family metallopeptidase [Treponema sp.]|nr:M23 family metallopeptidase [Treponema sp.]
MAKRGKGIALVMFIGFLFCAAPGASSQEAGFVVIDALPLISQMDRRDEAFRRYISEVEANRMLVFGRNRIRGTTSQRIADAMTFYRYVALEGDTLLSLAARASIPSSTLATLNRLESGGAVEPGMAVLLPSAPGIFVPEDPESDLEMLLASSRFPAEDEWISVSIPGAAGGVFYFFPGDEFTLSERAFFHNPGFFRFPLLSFRVTSGYGMRASPISGRMHFHRGIDLAAPAGTEVLAAAAGTVAEAGYDGVLGNFVRVVHSGNWTTLYGHMERLDATRGAAVRAGERIGWVGSTGYSTGPHLHFEMWQGGSAQNPADPLRP